MDQTSIDGFIFALSAGGVVACSALALNATFMHVAAQNLNWARRNAYLSDALQSELKDIQIGQSRYCTDGRVLTAVCCKEIKYLLVSEHERTFWLADLFPDTRLYKPIQLRRN